MPDRVVESSDVEVPEIPEILEKVEQVEEEIDQTTEALRNHHVDRLKNRRRRR